MDMLCVMCELHRNRPTHSPSLALPSFFLGFFFFNTFVINMDCLIDDSKNKTSVCGSFCEW